MPAAKYRSSSWSYNAIDGTFWALARSDGQVLEKLPDEGHKIWYRREDSKHQYRVAFILRKEVVGNAISCIPISSRLISIRISARPHNITVIQVYAPTSKHEVEKVEQC